MSVAELTRPSAIDLFAGCGGLTLGLSQAGFEVLAAVEIEPLAASTYGANHRRVKLIRENIRTVNILALRRALGLQRGSLTLLAGCPPCQGFSTLRTRNQAISVRDRRNDLLFQFVRFVDEFMPHHIMVENVPSLAKSRRISKFRSLLEDRGYTVRVGIVNAADYGVPQRRLRMVLIASRKKLPQLFEPSGLLTSSVRDAIGDLVPPAQSRDRLHAWPEQRTNRIKKLIACVSKNGGSRHSLPEELRLSCHRKTTGFNDVYGRMRWDDVAPTITSGCIDPSRGRFLHPSQNRAISLREAALLQTFPHDYYFDPARGKHAIAAMIGNALPPALVRRLAREIAQIR